MLRRDENRCIVDGCRVTRFLHAHHLRPRKEGGSGELDNLGTFCGQHHRAYHQGKLRQVTTEDGELRWVHV